MTLFRLHILADVQVSPAKPSRPTRVYLHLTNQDYLSILSDRVRDTQFPDAKASASDPALLGPPAVEFAPYGRVPNPKPRKDARQGTIDQDSEFIDFLESLTNPTTKAIPSDGGGDTEVKIDEMKVTPLIQYLRDKKANKGKDSAITTSKNVKHKRQDSKESKTSHGSEKKSSTKTVKDTSLQIEKRSASAIRVEKAARDAVKLLNKQAHTTNKAANPVQIAIPAPTAVITSPIPSAGSPVVPDRKRERGTVNAAARIQRDLGLGGNTGGRKRRDSPASATNTGPPIVIAKSLNTTQSTNTSNTHAPSKLANVTPAQPRPANSATKTPTIIARPSATQPPTGPAASRTPAKTTHVNPPRSCQGATPTSPRSNPPASTSTQAFLKHANPSQGITEPLLEQAFAVFGTVVRVEIDKKKGFAYIDFADPEGLQKAITASPIKVAQGQVVVLERKIGPPLQSRNTRGGAAASATRGNGSPMPSRGGRGGSVRGRGGATRGTVSTVVKKPAEPSSVTDPAPETAMASTSTLVTTTPLANYPDALTAIPDILQESS